MLNVSHPVRCTGERHKMAVMTIRLQTDPATGKKDIVVSLQSDEDMLPHEHEQQHRQLVEKLIEGGLLTAQEAGRIIVEREEETAMPEVLSSDNEQQQRESLDENA